MVCGIRFYPLCAICVEKVKVVGGSPSAEEVLNIVYMSLSRVAVTPSLSGDPRMALEADCYEKQVRRCPQ